MMKQMRKRLLAMLMSLALIVSLFPALSVPAAAAEVTQRTTPLDLTSTSVTYTGGSGEVNPTTTDINATDEGWSWAYSTKTLTLSGANIDCSAKTDCDYAIKLPDKATIVLAEDTTNTVKSGYKPVEDGSSYVNSFALQDTGTAGVSIRGNGTLTATGSDISLSETASDRTWPQSTGLQGPFTIGSDSDHPTVTANGGNITATVKLCYGSSYGAENVTIHSGKVSLTGGTVSSNVDATSYGADNCTVTGGEVQAAAKAATGKGNTWSYGIHYLKSISGGTVTATSGDTNDTSDNMPSVSCGIYSITEMTGGSITATGASATRGCQQLSNGVNTITKITGGSLYMIGKTSAAEAVTGVASSLAIKGSTKENAAKNTLAAARAETAAEATDGSAAIVMDTTEHPVALTALILSGPTVSVGAQSGTVSVGSGSATFAVTANNFTGTPTYTTAWCTSTGAAASAPTGITLTTSGNTLTATTTADAALGTYYFKVTAADTAKSETATSGVVALTVAAPTVAVVTFKDGTTTNYTDFATAWNAAVGDSTSGTDATTFKLLTDWTATADEDYGTSFGSGAGFGYGSGSTTGYIHIPSNKNIILDLNGHKIDRALTKPTGSTAPDAACAISNSGTLTLKDTSDNNTAGTSVKGIITGTYEKTASGENLVLPGCVDNMGTLTMQGGQITGNKSESNGAGVSNTGTFTMTGGKITANIANTDADDRGVGGGVYNSGGTFTMTGGEISGNYTVGVTMGGGVYNIASMTVGGTAVITGNYAGATYDTTNNKITAAGNSNNVYLPSDYGGITITCSTVTTLANGASIGVTTQTLPTSESPVDITDSNGAADYSAYFHSDNSDYEIYNDNTTDSSAQVVKLRVPSSATFDSRNGTAVTKDNYTTALTNWTSGKNTYTFDGWYTGIDGTGTKLTGTPASGTAYYAKWKNGSKTVRTQALDLSKQTSDTANADQGWSYVASTKTLTLDGATINTASDNALTVPDGTKISVSSASTVAAADGDAVYDAGALTVTGNGMLTVSGTACGIFSKDILIFDHAHVDAKATSFAICSDNDNIKIIGGDIKAAATAAIESCGILVNAQEKSLSVTESATVNATGKAMAISANTITMDASQSITVPTGGKVAEYTITNSDGTPATAVTIGKKADSGSGSSGGNSGSGSSSSTTTKPGTTTTSTVVVDGKTTDAGKVTTTTATDGTKTTTVAVDTTKLSAQVTAADKGSSVQVTVPETTGTASAQLVVKDVENLASRDMSLEIKTGNVTYTVAPNAIDTAKVATELGAADTSKVPLTVSVTPVKQSSVAVPQGTQVAPPVKFEVTATYNGKTVEVAHFDHYVSRTIALTEITDPSKITTGIRVEDGEQIPTEVSAQGGKLYAKINSLTNSTYAIIYNEASFSDTVGKWYNDIVTEMASRTIVNGKTSTTFDGDGYITRAEYAAILVRALGLPEGGTSSFSDVSGSDWYYGAVGAAVKYGIIKGYDDGSFKPLANISRQEAMAMLQRAAKVAEYAGTTGTLTSFTDADQVAAWAEAAAQFNVGSGLIVGSDGTIRPTDSITRAEAATVVLRLLQKAGLVDIRSKT